MAVLFARTTAAQEPPPLSIAVDRDLMPASAAVDLLTAERALGALGDRWLPPRRFDESRPWKRALGIGYRFGKWLALDRPEDHVLIVVGHEVFGHGARLREVGASPISYSIDAPFPYGRGGGVTAFSGDLLVTRADVLAIETSGIEAQNALADVIARQAIVHGVMPYREAWLYLESRLDGLRYIRSASPRSPPGHDVADFLIDVNEGCAPPMCEPLTGSALKRRALWMLADPMLAYAGYGWAVSYLVLGRRSAAVPAIRLPRDIRYLPAIRFEMTPYGTEWTSEHDFIHASRLTRASIRIGDAVGTPTWGVGVITDAVLKRDRVTVDVGGSIWQQPGLDAPPDPGALVTGGHAAVTAHVALGRASMPRAFIDVQAGYKTDGFLRGERLHAGPIVRVGFTVNP